MVTKGIIQSIDFNSNTCKVRIPLFETSGAHSEAETVAIFTNTPGLFNGYKVGDVVEVAFEDGAAGKPVVIGKLYLGASEESTDTRGTANIETLTVTKKANLPLDTTINFDDNKSTKAKVSGSYSSYNKLSDIIDGLQKTTESLSDAKVELKNTGDSLNAKVSKTSEGLTEGFGWNLQADKWTVYNTEQKDGEVVKTKDILTADKTGLYVNGRLDVAEASTIAGFNVGNRAIFSQQESDGTVNSKMKNLAELIEQNAGNPEYVKQLLDPSDGKPIGFEEPTSGVYVGTDGLRIGNKFSVTADGQVTASGLTIKLTPEQIEQLRFKIVKTYSTIQAMEDDWKSAEETKSNPQVKSGEFVSIDAGPLAEETGYVYSKREKEESSPTGKDTKHWKYITDMAGISGVSATAYRLACGALVHLGKNQTAAISVTAWSKTGSDDEVPDVAAKFKISGINATGWKPSEFVDDETQPSGVVTLIEDTTTHKVYGVTINLSTIQATATDIIVKAYHKNSGGNWIEFDQETITYSPLNTPVIALTNDSDSIAYKGNTKLGESVTTKAELVYNGEKKTPVAGSVSWTLNHLGPTTAQTSQTLVIDTIDDDYLRGDALVNMQWVDAAGRTWSTADQIIVEGKSVDNPHKIINKAFNVSKQLQGDDGDAATSYWLNVSAPVHTGPRQQGNIVVIAYKKVGESLEEIDSTATIQYKYKSGTSWQSYPAAGIDVTAHEEDLIIRALHNTTEYDNETVTYSPLNTPVLDLNNDSDVIKYTGDGTQVTTSVTSTASVWLNGKKMEPTPSAELPSGYTAFSYLESNGTQNINLGYTVSSGYVEVDFAPTRLTGSYGSGYDGVLGANSNPQMGWYAGGWTQGRDGSSTPYPPVIGTKYTYKWTASDGKFYIDGTDTGVVRAGGLSMIMFQCEGANKYARIYEVRVYDNSNTLIHKYIPCKNASGIAGFYDTVGAQFFSNTGTGTFIIGGGDGTVNYEWTTTGVIATGENTDTITVTGFDNGVTRAELECKATLGGRYDGVVLKKIFTVAKQQDGKDGKSAFYIDMENDFESIPCTATGSIPAEYQWSNTLHKLSFFNGTTRILHSEIFVGNSLPTGRTEKYLVKHAESTGVTMATSYPYFPATPAEEQDKLYGQISGLTADTGSVSYTLWDINADGTAKTQLASAKFEVVKQKMGEDGKSPVKYSIIPSANNIKVDKDNKRTPTGNISVDFKQTVGTTTTAFNGFCIYYLDGSTTGTWAPLSGVTTGLSNVELVGSGSASKSIKVDLYNDAARTTKVESETILVIKDGEKGEKGDDGDPGDSKETKQRYHLSHYKTVETLPSSEKDYSTWSQTVLTPTTDTPYCYSISEIITNGVSAFQAPATKFSTLDGMVSILSDVDGGIDIIKRETVGGTQEDPIYKYSVKADQINGVMSKDVTIAGYTIGETKLWSGQGSGSIALQSNQGDNNFTSAEYILSNGTNYIDTGFAVTSENFGSLKYVLDAMPTPTAQGNQWWANGNGGNSDNVFYVGLYWSATSTKEFVYGNGKADILTGVPCDINTRYRFELDIPNKTYKVYDAITNTLICNKTNIAVNTPTSGVPGNIYLCAWHNPTSSATSTPSAIFSQKVYSCKIYQGDRLVRNFVPVLYQSQFGLYDLVNSKFYKDPNNNAFDGAINADVQYSYTDGTNTYQRVEYIQSDGTQYIDINYIFSSEYGRVQAKLMPTELGSAYYTYRGAGSYGGTGKRAFILYNAYSTHYVGVGGSDFNTNIACEVDKIYELDYTANNGNLSTTINNISYNTTYTGTIITGRRYYLFANNENDDGSGGSKGKYKLYYFKLYDNGSLKFNLVPVKKTPNGEYGLFDTVNKVFYGKAAGNAFTGKDLTEISGSTFTAAGHTYRVLRYIESDGACYINSGVKQKNNSAVDCHFVIPGASSSDYLFGARQNNIGYGNNLFNGLYNNSTLEYNFTTIVQYTASNDIELKEKTTSNGMIITINGETNSVTLGTNADTTNDIYIFACNNSTVRYFAKPLRCYYFKMYEGSALVRNFIPVLQDSTTYGLFDLVSGTFYGNQGTGTFTGAGSISEFNSIYLGSEDEADAPFRVTNTGKLFATEATIKGDVYANNGYFNGTVNATAGNIGGCKIQNGTLEIPAANITGTLTIGKLPSTVAQKTDNISQFTNDAGFQNASQVTTITEDTLTTTNVVAQNLQVQKLLVKNNGGRVLLDAGSTNKYSVTIGGFDVTNSSLKAIRNTGDTYYDFWITPASAAATLYLANYNDYTTAKVGYKDMSIMQRVRFGTREFEISQEEETLFDQEGEPVTSFMGSRLSIGTCLQGACIMPKTAYESKSYNPYIIFPAFAANTTSSGTGNILGSGGDGASAYAAGSRFNSSVGVEGGGGVFEYFYNATVHNKYGTTSRYLVIKEYPLAGGTSSKPTVVPYMTVGDLWLVVHSGGDYYTTPSSGRYMWCIDNSIPGTLAGNVSFSSSRNFLILRIE